DHYIADQLNPPGVGPLVAHFGGTKTDSPSTLSYSAPPEIYNGGGAAVQMYAGLTHLGAHSGGGAMNEDTYIAAVRGMSAVYIVREDLDRLRLQSMSTSDKQKLDHWAELLHQSTGAVVRGGLCTDEQAAALGISQGGGGGGGGGGASLPDVVPAMMDLAVMNA